MNFFRGGDYQRRPGPYTHMHRAVCGQRARPAEAALARAGWTGVYMTRGGSPAKDRGYSTTVPTTNQGLPYGLPYGDR